MPALGEVLANYVPAMVLRHLVADGNKLEPCAVSFHGAVLFADVSGSTALAERLAKRGPGGAEEFSRILNGYFGTIIDVVTAHGGDVVKFAGDGLFALWPADGDALATATQSAAQGALALQSTLSGHADDGVRLSMRVGVGAGSLTGLCVGEPEHMEFVVVGAPVTAACAAERLAQPGEVVLAATAWALVRDRCAATDLEAGAARLDAVARPVPVSPLSPTPIDEVPDATLRAFVPPGILARLDAGQGEWLAERRRVTALFIQLPDWTETTLAQAQATMATVQAVLARYQGVVSRLGMDSRGPVVKAAFGLPPLAHEDDAVRGVQAALELQAALHAGGARCAIGVSWGRTFCGAIGSPRRREYTMAGDAVNLAARLMQASTDDILCDAAAYEASRAAVSFESLPAITAKGKSDPIAVYRPRGRSRKAAMVCRAALIGRSAERARLRDCVRQMAAGASRTLVVEGEAGIGKSRLVNDLTQHAQEAGVATLVGAGDAIALATAYHACRPLVSQIFHLDELPEDREARRERVGETLAAWADGPGSGNARLRALAPLLNPILGLDFPENEVTAQISGDARADNTHELLVRLVEHTARARPLVLIFEDAHWLDSASWAVVEMIQVRVRPLLMVVVTRPLGESLPPPYRRLLQAPETERIEVGLLRAEESDALVADRLGVRTVSEQVLRFIHERAGGHPLFAEELAHALRDAGVVHVSGDECRVAPGAGDLRSLELPETVEATLTGRIDRLAARQQLALKVASVLGPVFSGAALRDVYPIDGDKPHLAADLELLDHLDLIHRAPGEGADAYAFKHAIIRDVAYDLMAFAQRRQLHHAVAQWYERTYAGDLAPHYPLLAYHWGRAVDARLPDPTAGRRALDALERAGEQAAASYANSEVVQFLDEALRLQVPLGEAADPDGRRRARWHRHLADATNRLGRIPDAIDHALRALELMDQAFPRRPLRQYIGLGRELVRQVAHRLFPSWRGGAAGRVRDEVLETAHLCELLGLMWYVTLDSVPAALANLRALNLAERAGASPELATSSAMVGLLAAMLLGPRFSDYYFRRGQEAAREAGDRYGHGRVCFNRGFVYSGEARWPEVYAAFAEALATFEEIGDARWRDIAASMTASTCVLRRRYPEARRRYEAGGVSPRARGDVQGQAWFSEGVAICLVAEGQTVAGLEAFDRFEAWLANNFAHLADRTAELYVSAMRATAYFRLGRYPLAVQAVEENLRLVREAPPLTYYAVAGYAYCAEACLRLWDGGHVPRARIAPLALQAMRNLRRVARLYRLAQPSLKLWTGLLLWLRGHPRRARAAWEAVIPLAQALDMPWEEGQAHYEIGRHLAIGDPGRARHLVRAREIFATFELAYELEQTECLLPADVAVSPRREVVPRPASSVV